MSEEQVIRSARIVVLGAGVGGIGTAVRLKQAGIDDFIVLEKASELGGTWRDNTYPGCACDVPTAYYSYSFAPKADWSRMYARQAEIQGYLTEVSDRFKVTDHIVTDTEVLNAAWDVATSRWKIETTREDLEAEIVIAAAGPWHEPVIPDIPGLSEFPGKIFHSSRWDHDHDLTGERVAVVGTGASAVQFVPQIQPHVKQLHVFQRTPQWVLPKPDRRVSKVEQRIFRRFPAIQRALRAMIFVATEGLGYAQRHPRLIAPVQAIARTHLRRAVKDPELRRQITPTFTIGCKRTLFSNDWYPALQRENVEVAATAVASVRDNKIVGADGSEREVDTIILGTGFSFTDLPIAHRTRGIEGLTLDETWRGSPQGYLGTTVTGFPNMFILLGPNAGNGHGSAVFLIEAQLNYILGAIEELGRRGASHADVKPAVQERFNETVQAALHGSVWNAGGCSSYYLDANGSNAAMFPWSTIEFARRLKTFDADSYEFGFALEKATA